MTPAEARKAFKDRKAESLLKLRNETADALMAISTAQDAYVATLQQAAINHAARMVAATIACRETIEVQA